MKKYFASGILLIVVIFDVSGQAEVIFPDSKTDAAAFGFNLAQDGEWMLVGAKDDTINGIKSGAAYFFKLINYKWQLWQKIGPDPGEDGDLFGISVDIDGNYAVVGADGDDAVSLNSGAAYIFELKNDNWSLKHKMLPVETGIGSSEMGIAVSIKENIIVVGAYSDMTNGQFAGAGYIYSIHDGEWQLDDKVLPADGSADDKFGRSVHTDGNKVIMGGVLNDDEGTNSGSAYIFTYDGKNWIEEAKLVAPDANENDRFGRSVSIDNNYLAIGSVLDDDNGEQSGSVYMFRKSSNSWEFVQKITPVDGQADDFFGYALSFYNPYLLVGALNDDDFGLNSGAAYLFKREGERWNEITKLYAEFPEAEANFGEAVDLNAEFISIGAPYTLNNEVATGAAYVMSSPVITGKEQSEISTMSIYPNPVEELLYIGNSSRQTISKINIIDRSGRYVLQAQDNILGSVNVETLRPGIYVLEVNFAN